MKPRSAGHLERSSTIARDARDLAPLVRALPVPKRAALNSPHGGGETQLYGCLLYTSQEGHVGYACAR